MKRRVPWGTGAAAALNAVSIWSWRYLKEEFIFIVSLQPGE